MLPQHCFTENKTRRATGAFSLQANRKGFTPSAAGGGSALGVPRQRGQPGITGFPRLLLCPRRDVRAQTRCSQWRSAAAGDVLWLLPTFGLWQLDSTGT